MLTRKLGTDVLIGGSIFQRDELPFSPRCAIDGESSQSAPPSDHVGIICRGQNLANEMHTISVSIPATKSISQLWVDFIQYLPSSPASDGGTLFIAGTNLTALGPEWGPNQADATSFGGVQTNVNGADINVNFTGTFREDICCLFNWKRKEYTGSSFTWFGCPSDALPRLPPANVAYTIDGQSVEIISNNTLVQFDVELGYGNHQINVKYGGSFAEMPLTFCGFVVDSDQTSLINGISSSSLPSTALTPMMTSTPSMVRGTHTHTHSTDVGVILGATVAGVALMFLVSFILQSRRQHRRRHLIQSHSDVCGRA